MIEAMGNSIRAFLSTPGRRQGTTKATITNTSAERMAMATGDLMRVAAEHPSTRAGRPRRTTTLPSLRRSTNRRRKGRALFIPLLVVVIPREGGSSDVEAQSKAASAGVASVEGSVAPPTSGGKISANDKIICHKCGVKGHGSKGCDAKVKCVICTKETHISGFCAWLHKKNLLLLWWALEERGLDCLWQNMQRISILLQRRKLWLWFV